MFQFHTVPAVHWSTGGAVQGSPFGLTCHSSRPVPLHKRSGAFLVYQVPAVIFNKPFPLSLIIANGPLVLRVILCSVQVIIPDNKLK